jgi:hypothetical protein
LKPDRWFIGPPTYIVERHEWTLYGFDTRERAKAGHRRGNGRRSPRPSSMS